MTRLIVYVLLSLAVTAAAAWLIALPGTLTIDVAGYRMQPGLGATAFALIALVLIAIAAWAIVRRVIEAPKRVARARRQRRRDQGVEALSDGFIALQAGNIHHARSLAREAQTRLPDNVAAQLLEARSELALGELGAAREHYRALISNTKTAPAALAGLYEQARAQGRSDVALTFARKAVKLTPGITWAEDALFDDLTARAAWDEALAMTANQQAMNKAERAARRRRQAVLHTAIAANEETADPVGALGHAQSALKLQPDFVPAALIAARLFANRDDVRKAQSLLRRVWRATGHPDIATLFANSRPGASAVDRLKRARDLIGSRPADRDAAMVLARAAIDAYEWSLARNALAQFCASEPSQGVCMLMAEIEEGQNADQGKAREWLARAVHAPRDPVWVADGITSDEWEPVSPVTGKLDAFEWKIPVSAVATTRQGAPDTAEPEAEAPEQALAPPGTAQ